MYNMAGKLKHKADVYAKKPYKDEGGALKYKYHKIKSVWCAITPILGERSRAIKNEAMGDMIHSSISIKFIMRINALTVENDMYLVYMGQRYDVDYAVPYFKDMQYQEVYTQLRVGNDTNLPRGEYV